jgi:phage baseplate assembly protein V
MIDVIRREIQRALSGVRQGARAVLRSVVTGTRIQRVDAEALAGETLQDVELMQQFGFTSAPPAGAQLILIPLGGRTSAAVVVATEHGAYRFKVNNQGEAALYNQWGDSLHLRQDRTMRAVAGAKLEVVAPLSTFSGDVAIAGKLDVTQNITGLADITATGNVADQSGSKTMAGMRTAFNTHTHTDPQGGSVGTPSTSM